MTCGACKDVRREMISSLAQGRLVDAVTAAAKGARIIATGKPAAPPPVVPRSR